MKFKDYLKETTKGPVKLSKRDYSWGPLRKIEVGNSFSIIMHPEEWEMVEDCMKSKKKVSFKDEQRNRWIVSCDGTNVNFKSSGKKISVPVEKITKELK
jgi:hypothetical protein